MGIAGYIQTRLTRQLLGLSHYYIQRLQLIGAWCKSLITLVTVTLFPPPEGGFADRIDKGKP